MTDSMSTEEIKSTIKNKVVLDIEDDIYESAEASNWEKLLRMPFDQKSLFKKINNFSK